MEKYMGNKSKFCSNIYKEISRYIQIRGSTFFDPFTGTTNVSRYFKSKGANIVCNDINDFSYVLGKAYIENCSIPSFSDLYSKNQDFLRKLAIIEKKEDIDNKVKKLIRENKNTSSLLFTESKERTRYLEVLTYLTYYCDRDDYTGKTYNLFQDNYCENGKNSRYINLVYKKSLNNILEKHPNDEVGELIKSFFVYPFDERLIEKAELKAIAFGDTGTAEIIDKIIKKGNLVGERKFFSLAHAKRLDFILNTVCFWKKQEYISNNEYYILLASIIETVTIFSNTSATYQAFYKDYRANTLQDFRLIIPELDTTAIDSLVLQEDAYSIIPEVEADIIYLDPPYNWRQYDSNYHLLNTIARYNDIKNKPLFFRQIVGASGENRIQKLEYTNFNKSSTFEKLLLSRLAKCKCKVVALSYSDSSSNHKKGQINQTLDSITAFFADKEIFGSYNILSVDSIKFESRRGNKKELIHELLFIGLRK